MPIIIDGWNLIRDHNSAIDDLEGDSLEAASALINCLRDFQAAHKDPIILVFDSTNEYLGIKYADTALLKVVPARDADFYIKRYIDRTPDRQRPNLRVVSSDGDIYFYAKNCCAVPVKSGDFWNKIK
ncbi:MAG: NYN domain-containing protein [Candidatus Omnitrophota bacterium]